MVAAKCLYQSASADLEYGRGRQRDDPGFLAGNRVLDAKAGDEGGAGGAEVVWAG